MDAQEFRRQLNAGGRDYAYFDINRLEEKGIADIKRLPFTIKILVENLLRKLDGRIVKEEDRKYGDVHWFIGLQPFSHVISIKNAA